MCRNAIRRRGRAESADSSLQHDRIREGIALLRFVSRPAQRLVKAGKQSLGAFQGRYLALIHGLVRPLEGRC